MNIDTTVHEECNRIEVVAICVKEDLIFVPAKFPAPHTFQSCYIKERYEFPSKKKRALRVLATRQRIKTYTQKLEIV
jgi:hypothetical protein